MSVLLLAGQIGSGKSTVAGYIAQSSVSQVINVREELARILQIDSTDRAQMQELAAELDANSDGYWLVECLVTHSMTTENFVVDSVRTVRQVEAVCHEFNGTRIAYLEANEATRRLRYSLGRGTDLMKAAASFDLANQHPTEELVKDLRKFANLVIQTDDLPAHQIASIILGELA